MKFILCSMALLLLTANAFSQDIMQPSFNPRFSKQKFPEHNFLNATVRPDSVFYVVSIPPVNLLHSWYDYMIGSYNNLPLWVQPDPDYGGYFMTFHGKITNTSNRRAFYSYIDDFGAIQNMSEIPGSNIWEGFPALTIDNISGKPLYARHGNYDADPEYEVQFAYDEFLAGAAGIFSQPQIIIDNPITIAPFNSTGNEFIWPSLQIGPSPLFGMRRVYVLARNAESNTESPSENVYIAFADFSTAMLEDSDSLNWDYISIPELNSWNHDQNIWRRMSGSFVVGNDDKIYYIGYHVARTIFDDSYIEEPDIDVFICNNYGYGTWQRITGDSRYPSWNPHNMFTPGVGYFTTSDGLTSIPDAFLRWKIMNSGHFNAVFDGVNGKIHMPALWSQYHLESDGTNLSAFEYPNFHTVKDLVFNVNTQTFNIREIFPQAGNAIDDSFWLPWDTDADGVVDEYYMDDPQSPNYGDPLMQTIWPFSYWDNSILTSSMMFNYNHICVTQPDQYGNMAVVWQDSNRARLSGGVLQMPEIYISLSDDFGMSWSDPIIMNNIDTPALAGMKPMWVYPANQVRSHNGNGFNGKLGLMFFDDINWRANCLEYVVGRPNSDGYVRFMELDFPALAALEPTTSTQSFVLKQNYPNPFRLQTNISFNTSTKAMADLSIYNVKGQLVKKLFRGITDKGEHNCIWDGTDETGIRVSSGMYFCKLSQNNYTETRKLLLRNNLLTDIPAQASWSVCVIPAQAGILPLFE